MPDGIITAFQLWGPVNQVVDDVGGRLPNKFPTQGDPIASGICLDSGQGGHIIH